MSLASERIKRVGAVWGLLCCIILSFGEAVPMSAVEQTDLPVAPIVSTALAEDALIEAAPTVSAKAALLRSDTGEVLVAKNADARLPMASTTKIMTALIALESADPELVVTVPGSAVGVEGSSCYLVEGEQIKLIDLLYALLLQSANDAATAIAVALSGSVESFADRMNERAKEMGLTNTHFTNPHGLDHELHYTSASDLAEIAAVALRNEDFRTIAATKKYVSNSLSGVTRWFTNHNRMLTSYEGAIGVKTGYTMRTGRCLVSAAERDGLMLIAVTLCDPDDWRDHTSLLDYGFSLYERVTLAEVGQYAYDLPVTGGIQGFVCCTNRDSMTAWLLKKDAGAWSCEVKLPAFEFAPLDSETPEGKICFCLGDRELGELDLYPVQEVEAQLPKPTFWEKFGQVFRSLLRLIGNLLSKRAR